MKTPKNIKELSDLIHTICCRMNHTDRCAFYYPEAGENTRKHWEDCTQKLVDQFGFETVCDVVVKLRRIQFGYNVDEI